MEWVLVVITWYGSIEPAMHELPMSERRCKSTAVRLEQQFAAAREADERFFYIVECEERLL